MKITSSAFGNNSKIPSKYTCDGENINPPLEFSDIPNSAKSLVLIMDDPDVPRNLKPDGMFDHWIVYNIPPTTKEIKEGVKPPGIEGKNSAGKTQYIGACPPDREHRYFFKFYALDTSFEPSFGLTKEEIEKKMQGHIIAQTELIGLYSRK